MSNTVQGSINAVQAALGFWVPTVGTNSEPAITAANMTQQIVMSPPFKWSWNRNKANFAITSAAQDYTQTLTDFGYLEVGVVQNTATGKYISLNVLNNTPIGETADQQQPVTITAQNVTVGTSVVFRFLGIPDQNYTAYVTYQKFVPLITSTSATWTAPDYMSYIYNRGFLAFLYESRGDVRAQQEKVSFAAALLSTAEGLTDTEKNIFMAQFLANPRMLEGAQLKTQQGIQARGQ